MAFAATLEVPAYPLQIGVSGTMHVRPSGGPEREAGLDLGEATIP